MIDMSKTHPTYQAWKAREEAKKRAVEVERFLAAMDADRERSLNRLHGLVAKLYALGGE